MGAINIIIAILAAGAVAGVIVFSAIRKRKAAKSGSVGCSGCCEGCTHCSHASRKK